jgi:hypothetical protein
MRLGGFELAGCSNLVGGRTGATSNAASLNAADVPKEPFFD